MDDYIGVVKIFPGNTIPANWMLCNGQHLPIKGNEELYGIIGTTYGGDGVTDFALPNLMCRIPVGTGAAPYHLGATGGGDTVVLNQSNLPTHTHIALTGKSQATVSVNSGNAGQSVPTIGSSIAATGFLNGTTFNATLGFNTATPDTHLNSASVAVDFNVVNSPAGSDSPAPINIMPPFMGMNYIICIKGIYPSPQ
jgi:microcystin-dependent protein